MRVGDLLHNFEEKYNKKKKRHLDILSQYNYDISTLKDLEDKWFDGLKKLQEFELIDSEFVINEALNNEKKILAEGAQGTMLDIDFGSYPLLHLPTQYQLEHVQV